MLLVSAALLHAAPKRVLYYTQTAGFRHDCIPFSQQVLADLGAQTGAFEVTLSEDPAMIAAAKLRDFDTVFFYTSGELPFSDPQKQALLDFVASGGGFGGAHSATDTLYSWPEYGDLIGGRFDGHPWTQEGGIKVEDGRHPAMRGLGPSFGITDEIYQFRDFSRDRIHVLMSLDTATVDPAAPGVNRKDGDFPLAWYRRYGSGRVFYTALGHFEEVWRDVRFQQILSGALLWLTRTPSRPRVEPMLFRVPPEFPPR
jgi:uncharacterized protein